MDAEQQTPQNSSPATDKRAVVTGAARGIGRAIVEELVATGHEVVAVDIDFNDTEPFSGAVHQLVGDVSDPEVHKRAAELGSLQLVSWVNNAGIAPNTPLHSLCPEELCEAMSVNVGGVVWGAQAALRDMLRRGTSGSIVNVSSTQGLLGFDDYPAYAATKGAINAFTRQVASQYARSGVRCNTVVPGVIDTELNRNRVELSDDPAALQAQLLALCPVGHLGTPQDVARAVGWLCNPLQSFVTGQMLVVDGGQTIRPLSEPQ